MCALELEMPAHTQILNAKNPIDNVTTNVALQKRMPLECDVEINFQNSKQFIMIRSGTYMVAAHFLFRSLKFFLVVESCAFFEEWHCSVLVNSI